MGWRIIYIEQANSMKLYLDNVKVINDYGEVTIPLSDIHTIVVDNQLVALTVPLINKCSEYNVNLIFCSLEHMPQSFISPLNGNYKAPAILKKQMSWSDDFKDVIWKKIVINKIENQSELLKKLDKDFEVIERLSEFCEEVEEGDLTNREGLAAKMYFRELFGPNFKRFDCDIINAGLNYGYAILRSQISKTIVAKGLNPNIGIHHIGYDNFFNLSDDIIEVFRPIIDEYVYKMMKHSVVFTKNDRMGLIKQTSCDVYINGTRQTLFNAIEIFVEKIMWFFETGDVDAYLPIRLIYEL
ncbi:MAG: type II CRISPR-associated endonuclease Cas1 [bacterium]|nr:type II CRISPR-associated endonuclease Cas1 [bacterium]MDY4108779.1 type II CRISPR-associated endonuclease Cas1 [Bacilli bacterium]